jgi:hypothetical protein
MKEFDVILFSNGNPECTEAESLLKKSGIDYIKLTPGVDIEANLKTGETFETPEVATNNGEYKGLGRIASFVNKVATH